MNISNIFPFRYPKSVFVGLSIWLIVSILWFANPQSDVWARLLLLFAILVMVQIGFSILHDLNENMKFILDVWPIAAILSLVSIHLPEGFLAATFVVPWVLISLILFLKSADGINLTFSISEWTITAAQLFLIVGTLWLFADRLGLQPLGFDKAIVLLTVVHFHFAGFMFTLLCGLIARFSNTKSARLACIMAVISVPMTALGITLSQLYQSHIVEILAAVCVSLSGFCMAFAVYQFNKTFKIKYINTLFTILYLSLCVSMTLAFLYAIRFWYPIGFLQIPFMRAIHGTLNAIFVCGGGLLAWKMYLNQNTKNA